MVSAFMWLLANGTNAPAQRRPGEAWVRISADHHQWLVFMRRLGCRSRDSDRRLAAKGATLMWQCRSGSADSLTVVLHHANDGDNQERHVDDRKHSDGQVGRE